MARNFFSRFTRTRARPRRISVFDGQDLKRATLAACVWLEQHREAINALNVYPVPDGDTGTNMTLTLRAATNEIADATDTAACVIAEKLSRGALMGARGNSGSILSQILRGVSGGIEKKTTLTANDFALALQDGARAAYRCVITPVEGTILTVVREAAEAAHQSAMRGSDMVSMLDDTVSAAKIAVAKTPDLLPKLKEAGVVDAGGQGLMTILEGMLRYTRGETLETPARPANSTAALDAEFRKGMVDVEEDEYGYEVVFLLEGENLDVEGIRNTITAMGGVSTVVAGDSTLLKVHTHTPTPGQILDYGVSLGSLQDINIENLQAQSERYAADSKRQRGIVPSVAAHAASGNGSGSGSGNFASAASGMSSVATATQDAAQEARPIGMVAVVSGEGWIEVYRGFGATIVPGGQSMNPSTQELLEAVENCPSDQVFLLPNNNNILMSARQVPELTQKRVQVIATDTPAQGVAALLAFNFEADFDTNMAAMEAASAGSDTAEITRAVRTAQVDGLAVSEGDILGLINGKVRSVGTDMQEVVRDTLTRMGAADHEILTIYYGEGVSGVTANELAQQVKGWFPDLEIEVVNGGQPHYAYIISAE